ncbi:hypothetical protein ACSBR1_025781 [Camellia fascicularis]
MTFSITEQFSSGENEFPIPTSQYNPLDEPSPLGLLQMRPTQGNVSSVTSAPSGNLSLRDRKDVKGTATSATTIKLKASNFRALLLRIGQWEEILEGGLQSKIEIQWSDIIALKANLPDDGPGSLTVTLTKPSYFFKETNPQPRKHTLWQATAEFTDGQASLHSSETKAKLLCKSIIVLNPCEGCKLVSTDSTPTCIYTLNGCETSTGTILSFGVQIQIHETNPTLLDNCSPAGKVSHHHSMGSIRNKRVHQIMRCVCSQQHFLHTRPVKQTVGIYFLSINTCQGDADVSAEVPRVLVVCAEMILARSRLSPKKSESQISG